MVSPHEGTALLPRGSIPCICAETPDWTNHIVERHPEEGRISMSMIKGKTNNHAHKEAEDERAEQGADEALESSLVTRQITARDWA